MNRQGIAFLLVSLLVLDAVSAQLSSVSKPSFRGQNKILAMEEDAPVVKVPVKQQAIVDNQKKVIGGVKHAGHADKPKPDIKKGGAKEEYGDNKGGDYYEEENYTKPQTPTKACTKPPTCTKPVPRNFPSYHNTYELKYQTIGCSMRTVDQIVNECRTIDIIKSKPECINRVETIPVKVQKINELKKKIKVVKAVQKKIHVIKEVQKPVETLVTQCVTVYEVVTQDVCIDTLACYTTNERHIVEDKVNIRYEEPKQTQIRVVKPIKKQIKVVKTACVKYDASISQKSCDKQKSYGQTKGYGYGDKNNYKPNVGNQYQAVKQVKAAAPAKVGPAVQAPAIKH